MGSKEAVKALGGGMKADFPFDHEWTNLNHGSFGSIPKAIQAKLREYQDMFEARPDQFLRYDYPRLIDESRAAVAELVGAPVETVVLVSNATEGINTVFRNLAWADDGNDVIVYFSTIYEACGKVIDFIVDYHGEDRVSSREIELAYPLEDDDIVRLFGEAVDRIEAEGKRARACVLDVVSSRPGVVFPWEAVVRACRRRSVLSVVDGAQGVGMVRLDLAAADPDFFVSNCHKWLFAPRGCAVFYVPLRNQALLPTTLATSHGYAPRTGPRTTTTTPSAKSHFVNNFQFVGTTDNSPYLCVKDAVAYRRDVLGGEERVMEYLWDLSKKGSEHVAEALGTYVLENSRGTLRNCALANVALPIRQQGDGDEGSRQEGDVVIPAGQAQQALQWMMKTFFDYKTTMPLFWIGGRLWARISAQVYLDMKDYEYAAKVLRELCERVAQKEYLEKQEES